MRVIHIVSSISEAAAGPSYSVVRLCESLCQSGCETTLATLRGTVDGPFAPNVRTFPISNRPKKLGISIGMKQWLTHEVRSNHVDIIHAHGMWMMPNVYPGLVASKHDVAVIVSPRGMLSEWAMTHGSIAKKVFWPLIQRPSLKSAHCFHATAMSEYQDIRRVGLSQPIALIPNGIDIPPAIGIEQSEERELLFLGRIHPKKGVDMLLRAWSFVQAEFPAWRLRVVGPDNDGYLGKMKGLAADLKLERVEFSGPLFGNDKLKAYRRADLFVLPTHSENFGLTVAEALSSGTPVIVSKGAPWEMVEAKGAGWWIEIGSEPLVQALRCALTHTRQELRAMGDHGRRWMEAEFSWGGVCKKMIQTYEWILEGMSSKNAPAWVQH